MQMSVREAFDKHTESFNAHNLDGFAELLADDVVFHAPGGAAGQGKAECREFYGSWLTAFPDAHVQINGLHVIDDVAVEEGTFTGTHEDILPSPTVRSHPPVALWRWSTSRCAASATGRMCPLT